jgi:hypothetical protein
VLPRFALQKRPPRLPDAKSILFQLGIAAINDHFAIDLDLLTIQAYDVFPAISLETKFHTSRYTIMTRIVEFTTKEGKQVLVEVDEGWALHGEVLAANDSGIAAKAKKSFEEALASVKPGIDAALNSLTDLISKPKETEIEFGLKLDAAAGAIFAKAGAEATFKVKLTWK